MKLKVAFFIIFLITPLLYCSDVKPDPLNKSLNSPDGIFLKELANNEKRNRLYRSNLASYSGASLIIGAAFMENSESQKKLMGLGGLYVTLGLLNRYSFRSIEERKYQMYLEGSSSSARELIIDLRNEYRKNRYIGATAFALLGLAFPAPSSQSCEEAINPGNCNSHSHDMYILTRSFLFATAALIYLFPMPNEQKCNEYLNENHSIGLHPTIGLDSASLALNIRF